MILRNRLTFLTVLLVGIVIAAVLPRLAAQDTTTPTNPAPRPLPSQWPQRPAGVEHVFIVSFDGGKPSVMQESDMPFFKSLLKNAAVSWQAQTISPSITLVSHTSMVTGVKPATHGILWNSWKPERGPVKVPTVFQLARAKGLRTALFAGKDKFDHLNIPGTLDKSFTPSADAGKVAAEAAAYIKTNRPQMTMVHFPDPDTAGHAYGWGSPEQKKSFADCDKALRVVYEAARTAGILHKSTWIFSADHGGHGRTHGTDLPDDMTIPWIATGAGVKAGTLPRPILTCDTAATALWLHGITVPPTWDGRPVAEAFTR